MSTTEVAPVDPHDGEVAIGTIEARQQVRVTGQVRSLRVQPWGDAATLECRLADDSGGITVVFLGRRRVAGIVLGAVLTVDGMVGVHGRRLAILNPAYRLHAS